MTFTVSELRGPESPACDALLPAAAVAFPSRPAAPRVALHRLLDEHLALPPEYRAGLSSHLPMALHALDALGADEARMRAFAQAYVPRFLPEDASPPGPPLEGDWARHLGRFDAFEPLRGRFARDLAREGRDAVLRRVLPPLLEGVAAAAFHGVIRTAHAVDARHDGELAAGLAYWAARWQPMPSLPDEVPRDCQLEDVGDWLDALDATWRREDTPPARRLPLISDRTLEAAGTHAWRRLAGALRTHDRDAGQRLQALALACAGRYATSRNLTVLHLVTGARAALVLAPWLPADEAALDPLWHAVAAASLSSGLALPGAAPRAPVPAMDWDGLRRAAIAQDDDHAIKLVHALWSLEATRMHPDGRRAAAVAVAG